MGATASIYFSYLLGNLAVMRARTKGWPRRRRRSRSGVWGKVVNAVAILWGAAMLLNFLCALLGHLRVRPERSGANYLRIFSNPKPVQTDYYVEGSSSSTSRSTS